MEIAAWQKELMALLCEKGLPREDLLSVMLVLSKEEAAKEMTAFLLENEKLDADAICRKAGEIAFGKNT